MRGAEKTKQQLAERDNLFGVFTAIRDGVLLISDTYDLLYVNEVLEETFGPWEGKKCYKYLSMGHAPCEGCWAAPAGRGKPDQREWLCSKNHRTYEITATSIQNLDGSRSRLRVLRDITARTRAEEALRESEQRFRLISENIPVVVYSVLPNQQPVSVFVSSRITELTGYSAKELTETPTLFKSTIHPDDREQAWEKIMEHRRKKTALDIEYRIVTPAGQVKWVVNKATLLLDENGETTCVNGFLEDITERKQAEEALRNERDFATGLVETAQAIVLVLDPRGKIVSFNPYMERISGYPLHEVRGKDWFDTFLPERRRAEVRALFTRAIGEAPTRGNVDPLLTRDGRELLIEWYDKVLKNAKGEVVGLFAIGQDVTERKRSEDARQSQLEFLQTLMDTIPNPIFYKDSNQIYAGCNQAFEQFVGLPKTQIIGKSVYEIAPKDLADEYFEKDSELLRHPGTQVYESKVRTGGGEVRGVIFSKATFAGSDGKVAGLLGVIVDITDLKRIQVALQLREELYRTRFENSPIALWEEDLSNIKAYIEVLRSEGVQDFRAYFRDHPEEIATCSDMVIMTDANAATLELFQCSTFEDLEHLVRQHAGHRTSDALVETLIAMGEGADSFARECITRTAGGQEKFLSLRWVVAPGHTETLATVLFSALDITHLKDVEMELRAAESKLRTHSEELEKIVESRTERIKQLERQRSASEAHAATGRLAARIAHEINNPLAGIKNSFLLVKRAVPTGHPRYEYVALIEHEIDRIALIVRKMFELYRDEKQVRHEILVVDGIREVLRISEGFLREKEILVELNVPDEPVTANLPTGFLTQVILNLLRNAADASEPHGTITVSVDAHNGEVVVKVRDRGQGISDENAPHIFEPFFTTKAHTEMGGLGLGLAVSRSMVEAIGGSITFETCPGKGTTFRLAVPVGKDNKEVRNGGGG
ncbi:MAG: PAS domain S-box protein [Candidatus Eisenbacteria bacterium]